MPNQQPSGSSLTVCCIAKNEEDIIADMISSVKAVADEIIVADVGSTDGTKTIAEQNGARVVSLDWIDNFSALRNQLSAMAQHPWVLHLDADEVLAQQSQQSVLEFCKGNHKAAQCTIYHEVEQNCVIVAVPTLSIRLYRRQPNIQFSGRIKESIEPSLLKIALSPSPTEISIVHRGFSSAKPSRRLRLRSIFEEEHRGDPTNYWTSFHLGVSLYCEKEYSKADSLFQQILLSQNREVLPDFRASLLALTAQQMIREEKLVQSRTQLSRALQIGSGNVMAKSVFTELEMANGQYEQAISRFGALESTLGKFCTVKRAVIYSEIVRCCLLLKKQDAALSFSELALEAPMYDTMMVGGMLREQRADFKEALKYYTIALSLEPDSNRPKERIAVCKAKLGHE